ncbi:hypothetical protein GCM10010495_38410 [Kitasatospora herbaricolor]|uniref:DUF7489 domain-containing protein n=1 Tax=Kitasatospora herbaricolor TaxID=68217 RepID=UPI00174806E0|nr:hypothetical protein [Kitasatospora herbaricolor]MDQ0306867.1 hypothetical protein [Kitasatospora herbaricolor]GGV19564.1 hypothetical protein GCM10010495_38410 [Kitasatospora herbaricolor]
MPVLVFMLVAGVVILLALTAIASSSDSASRATAQAFEGEVIRRYSEQHTLTTGMRTDYWLDVRTVDGEVVSITLPGRICSRFKVGDRIVKRVGERWPST